MNFNLAEWVPAPQTNPSAESREQGTASHPGAAGANRREPGTRTSAFDRELAKGAAEPDPASGRDPARQHLEAGEPSAPPESNRVERRQASRGREAVAMSFFTETEVEGALPGGVAGPEGGAPFGTNDVVRHRNPQEEGPIDLVGEEAARKRSRILGVSAEQIEIQTSEPAGALSARTFPGAGAPFVEPGQESGPVKGGPLPAISGDAVQGAEAGKTTVFVGTVEQETFRVAATGEGGAPPEGAVKEEQASSTAATGQQGGSRMPSGQFRVNSPEASPAFEGLRRAPETSEQTSQTQASGREPETGEGPPGGEKVDVRAERQAGGAVPASALRGPEGRVEAIRVQGAGSEASQARPEQADLPRDPGASRGDQGLDRREHAFVRQDTGAPQMSVARESQPVFDLRSGDLQGGDPVSQTGAASEPGGKTAPVAQPGHHADPSARPHPSGTGPSVEARGGDPAQMEARASFDASGKTAHLRIHDQGLGSMHWHLRMEGGRVAAEAVVQSARVHDLVHANQDALQTRLHELGVRMDGFSVSVDQGSHGFFGHTPHRPVVPAVGGEHVMPDPLVDTGASENRNLALGGRLDLYA